MLLNPAVHGQCQIGELTGDADPKGDAFGQSVAVSAGIAVVGDPLANEGLGALFVYRFDGESWVHEATLNPPPGECCPPNGAVPDSLGSSVAIDGDVIVGGAPHTDAVDSDSGAAHIFRYDRSIQEWVFEATLIPSDGDFGDMFGFSVDVDGDIALISARDDENDGINHAGSAYVFRYSGSDWVEQAKLTDPNSEEFDLFGVSVSICGDAALVGAHGNDDAGSGTGAAFVFRNDPDNPTQWELETQLSAADAQWLAWFGYSVSLGENIAVIGAPQDDGQTGAAYVLRYDGRNWIHQTKLVASNPSGPGPFFGNSTGLGENGTTIAVGAARDDAQGFESGAAHVFLANQAGWEELPKLTPSAGSAGGHFGISVATDAESVFVGATRASEVAGSVFIFKVAGGPADLNCDRTVGAADLLILLSSWGVCDLCGACTADLNHDCTVGVADLLILLANWG